MAYGTVSPSLSVYSVLLFLILVLAMPFVFPSIVTSGFTIHDGAKCVACNNKIVELRFKCLDCPDFDLCSNCEPKMVHTGHLLLRIGQPIEVS